MIKQTKNKIIFVILAVIIMACLVSCGISSSEAKGTSFSIEEKETPEITESAKDEIVNEENTTEQTSDIDDVKQKSNSTDTKGTTETVTNSETEKEGSSYETTESKVDTEIIINVSYGSVAQTPLASTKIPEYSDQIAIILNNDSPEFEESDFLYSQGDIILSDFDELGRSGAAMMIAGPDTLPVEERGETGAFKPSGWNQNKYPGLVDSDPPYLMNRGHILMWALCGLTDAEENLLSVTRYMNVEGMLPVEEEVLSYIKKSNDSVLYRVSPVYNGDDLLASGVIMEAAALTGDFHLCRYVYNVQPGVEIDYSTGENWLAEEVIVPVTSSSDTEGSERFVVADDPVPETPTPEPELTEIPVEEFDFILNNNSYKFHKPWCESVPEISESNKQGFNGTAEEVLALGYTACHMCCSEWVTPEPTPEPTAEPVAAIAGEDYVLNTNTHKFHYTWCKSVNQMKDKNKKYYTGTREEVISMGYEPCKNCNP